ncbi:MAG: tetratricopeptide repeat protein, partial [Roseiarcus sp.]
LIGVETGNHLWAERFDKPVADLFDMQDEIVARLANQLDAELVAAEARRAERTLNPDAMDLNFQGVAWLNRGWTPEFLTRARGFFERALALDPGNLDALVGAARIDATMAANFMTDNGAERLEAAEANITKALSAAPDDAFAHTVWGLVQTVSNRAAEGVAEFKKALSLNPNLAIAHAMIGWAKILLGRAQETEGHVLKALRLSPRDTLAHVFYRSIGVAKLYTGADQEAVAWHCRSIESNRNVPLAHFGLAAALAHLGRTEEARSAARAGLALDPNFTMSRYRANAVSDNPTFQAQRERFAEGLHKAGVPEG